MYSLAYSQNQFDWSIEICQVIIVYFVYNIERKIRFNNTRKKNIIFNTYCYVRNYLMI